ncbi:ATP-binding cassette domain-containing protein [Candidatus Roizmanbacteria bacterium]|nr:ATP-binding cassette domain-containing protein [Candidatus Roizmanbacteria bacterium]
MTSVISVQGLKKHFRVTQKKGGVRDTIISLVKPTYRDVLAVDDVSFEIEEGEVVAFLGPNGAGKTTTLKMLSGILYPTSGEVRVLQYIPHERKTDFQKQISLVMGQKNQLWWDLPAIDTFLLNKDIYGISDHTYNHSLHELVELMEAGQILNIPVRRLSLGQRMKCELIASLLHRPKVLFLDEPTIGLDIVVQKKLRNFLKEYNQKHRTTIILTSHYMGDVKEICKRVILINRGKKMYDGSIDELVQNYAKDKYVAVDFESKITKTDLEAVRGIKILEFDGSKAVLSIPRNTHTQKCAELLTKFPVIDLNIREVELEDVIVKFYSRKV